MSYQDTLPALNAKSLMLDLLRMVQPLSLPVSLLVDAGRVLSINENAIRVNITRLLAKQQIEQDERGYYRLGKESEVFGDWLKAWQKGEKRVKAWKGDWLLLSTSRDLKTTEEQDVFRLAHHFGFREMLKGNWIRPNNLNRSNESLAQQIAALAHVNQFFISEIQSPVQPDGTQTISLKSLWDTVLLEKQYQEVLKVLHAGIKKIDGLSIERAFRDSYLVGAEVHHRLAVDPLLPKELVDTKLRQEVIDSFAEYDKYYRPAWLEFFAGYSLKVSERSFDSARLISAF